MTSSAWFLLPSKDDNKLYYLIRLTVFEQMKEYWYRRFVILNFSSLETDSLQGLHSGRSGFRLVVVTLTSCFVAMTILVTTTVIPLHQ